MKPFQPLTSLPFRTVNNFASHTASPKKVLFLTYRFPYPLSGGDRLKCYHLLRHLSEISEVDLISLDEWQTATHENLLHIKQFASTVTVVPFSKASAIKRATLSLFTKTPVEYAWYNSPQMQEVVDIALRHKRYDLIVCFFMRTASYVTDVTDTPKILVAEDSRLLADQRATETFSFSPEYFVRKIDAGKLRTYEPYTSHKFDVTTFVAPPDQHHLLAIDPTLKTSILSNGVDTSSYLFYEGEKENSILFAGHLGIYHNRVMAERILKNIYPLIRERSPQTKLYIVGKDPDAALTALVRSTPGAELQENVPDMKPYYRKASLFIHPQEIGAGIQNKLLESMAMGTPVITSAIGASGIAGIINQMHLLVSETDEEFVEVALSLLAHSDECRRLAQNARKLIEQRYTWERVFDAFDKIISSVVPNFFILPKRVTQAVSNTNGSH
jgi:glycosyltransferase involved in cell wall biosynthesis